MNDRNEDAPSRTRPTLLPRIAMLAGFLLFAGAAILGYLRQNFTEVVSSVGLFGLGTGLLAGGCVALRRRRAGHGLLPIDRDAHPFWFFAAVTVEMLGGIAALGIAAWMALGDLPI